MSRLPTTALTPFVLIRASRLVSWSGDSPGVASHAPQEYERLSFEDYLPVLELLHAMMPTDQVITLLADRGFVHQQLLTYCQRTGWHFRLRLTGKTLVHLEDSSVCAVKELCPEARTGSVLPGGVDFRSSDCRERM